MESVLAWWCGDRNPCHCLYRARHAAGQRTAARRKSVHAHRGIGCCSSPHGCGRYVSANRSLFRRVQAPTCQGCLRHSRHPGRSARHSGDHPHTLSCSRGSYGRNDPNADRNPGHTLGGHCWNRGYPCRCRVRSSKIPESSSQCRLTRCFRRTFRRFCAGRTRRAA